MENVYIIQRRADGRRFTIHDSRFTIHDQRIVEGETDYSPLNLNLTRILVLT